MYEQGLAAFRRQTRDSREPCDLLRWNDLANGTDLSSAPTSRPAPRPRRYAFTKASRSALMVSALVVGMPCGKPL